MRATSQLQGHREIARLAAPIMLANLSVPLLGVVDTAILGHLASPVYLGAVAIGSQLLSILFWAFGFLRMGTTSLAGRLYGAEEYDELGILLARSIVMALALALGILLLQGIAIPTGLGWIANGGEIEELANEYARIRIWSAPATLINYCIIGWFIGLQNTRLPMIIMIATNVLNILLDYLLVIVLEMNSVGAAWASLVAEYAGLGLALLLLRGEIAGLQWNPDFALIKAAIARLQEYRELLAVNRDLFFRTLALMFTLAFVTAQGARMGENILAGNAILISLLYVTAFGLDGIAHATEALTGKAWGANDQATFRRICRQSTQVAVSLAAISSLALFALKSLIITGFTSITEIREIASIYYPWVAFLPVIGVWAYQFDGIFIGIGMTREMLYSMIFSTFVVFLPAWWLTGEMGNNGLWLALWCWLISRGFTQYLFLRPRLRET